MVGYWLFELFGRSNENPYLGLIFFLILPGLFILGLALIPVGVFQRRGRLKKARQIPAVFPHVDLNDRAFRHGLGIALIAAVANVLGVSVASHRRPASMAPPQFFAH